MARIIAVAVLAVLLVVTTGEPVAAQEPRDDGSLVALCEANAPDEATRDDCVHIAVTVLTSAKATTPLDQFESGFAAVLNRYSAPETASGPDGEVLGTELPLAALHRGRWSPKDPQSGRTLDLAKKKQARRARVVAGMAAEDLTEYLASVTPEDCYVGLYGALWGLATAWGYYADGLVNAKRGLTPALEEFAQVASITHCSLPTHHLDVVPPATLG